MKKPIYILACDPSLREFGWSIIELHTAQLIDFGIFKTEHEEFYINSKNKKVKIKKANDLCRRIDELSLDLVEALNSFPISHIVSEQPHGSQSYNAAVGQGLMLGAVSMMAVASGISLEWFSEGDCKKCLLGKREAEKIETYEAIDKLYNIVWPKYKYQKYALADSVAVFHKANADSSVLKKLKSAEL